MLDHTSGNDKDCDHVNKEYKGECFTCNAIQSAHSEPPINTIEPDKNIEASTFFQKLGFKVSLVDEELWLPVAKFAEVKAEIDHLITQAQIQASLTELKDIREKQGGHNLDEMCCELCDRINNLQDIKEGE